MKRDLHFLGGLSAEFTGTMEPQTERVNGQDALGEDNMIHIN